MIGLGGRGFWGSRLTHFRIFYKKPAASAIFQARCIATTSHAQATRTTFASSRSRFDSARPSHRLRGQSFCTSVKMAEKWPASKVREEFLRFFEEKEHTIGTPIISTCYYAPVVFLMVYSSHYWYCILLAPKMENFDKTSSPKPLLAMGLAVLPQPRLMVLYFSSTRIHTHMRLFH
jgi:hypothetical protein